RERERLGGSDMVGSALSVAEKVTSALKQALKWVKPPWKISGPVASPEYLDPVPGALEYRVFSPASNPKEAIIPQSEPDRVLNITYYTRDPRRAFALAAKKETDNTEPTTNEQDSSPVPKNPSPTYFVLGARVPIGDNPNGGYQK
ncbi:hypothetical protein GOP47_0025094, partial [Adiantum capillus-veneris]